MQTDVAVIGGGAAGLAATLGAAMAGAQVALIERDRALGGILLQCIHNGFGLHRFGRELTGPEYAAQDIQALAPFIERGQVEVLLECSVLAVSEAKTVPFRHMLELLSARKGSVELQAKAVVFACGCRERTRAQIGIPGTRPAGVLTAGAAQRLCNIDGALVGKRVVILGSGDIGLIMARRMTWEGAHVLCVCELASEPGGLRRNIVQCLDDNDIPLLLSCTVTNIFGSPRLEAVELCDVDPKTRMPKPETARRVSCDALLLSVGLIPDNELCLQLGVELNHKTSGPVVTQHYETSVPGIFVAGNELHVHDLADFVSEEGLAAGSAAADFAYHVVHQSEQTPQAFGVQCASEQLITVASGTNVGAVTPNYIACEPVEGPYTSDSSKPAASSNIRTSARGRAKPSFPVLSYPGTTSADIPLRFRPTQRMEKACILVSSGGKILKRSNKEVVVPSEMITIKLKPQDLSDLDHEILVECVPQCST